jgi:proteasome lid subunit RPN8/RPN11
MTEPEEQAASEESEAVPAETEAAAAPEADPVEVEMELAEDPASELPEGEDPAERPGVDLLQLGAPVKEPRWILGYACLKQMLAHGQRHKNMEVGGVLLGAIWQGPAGRVTEVCEALPASHTEASLGHVTFSHETWAEIYDYLESSGTDLKIVGWYHSHPGFGAFFSGQDRFIQQNFFSGEGQLGVVVDPHREELAAFHSETGVVEEMPGLWLLAADESVEAARQMEKRLSFPAGARAPRSLWQRLRGVVLPRHEE